MSLEALGEKALDYLPCRYGHSKLLFRGPRRDLDGRYVAFLGGTETYGKFVQMPFVDLLEANLELPCVNFGCPNAGVDVFLQDPFLPSAARKATVTVLQVPCAQNMSNRLYSVHPRRNDRFTSATMMLKSFYPEVDFAGYHFTKHLLKHLKDLSEERYGLVVNELRQAWVARMNTLLTQIEGRVILLWVSDRAPNDIDDIETEPMFVDQAMIEAVMPNATDYIEVVLDKDTRPNPTEGMVFDEMEAMAAREMMGPHDHLRVAETLRPLLSAMTL